MGNCGSCLGEHGSSVEVENYQLLFYGPTCLKPIWFSVLNLVFVWLSQVEVLIVWRRFATIYRLLKGTVLNFLRH